MEGSLRGLAGLPAIKTRGGLANGPHTGASGVAYLSCGDTTSTVYVDNEGIGSCMETHLVDEGGLRLRGVEQQLHDLRAPALAGPMERRPLGCAAVVDRHARLELGAHLALLPRRALLVCLLAVQLVDLPVEPGDGLRRLQGLLELVGAQEVLHLDGLGLGLRFLDHVSLGAGVDLQYIDVELTNAVPNLAPTAPDGLARVKGDDISVGWNAGVMVELDPVRIGAHYRSQVEHDLEGTFELSGLLGPLAGNNASVDATAPLTLLPHTTATRAHARIPPLNSPLSPKNKRLSSLHMVVLDLF